MSIKKHLNFLELLYKKKGHFPRSKNLLICSKINSFPLIIYKKFKSVDGKTCGNATFINFVSFVIFIGYTSCF